MIYPDAAARFTGTFVVLDWWVPVVAERSKKRTHSGGRVLRVDDTYLHLQPFSLAPNQPPAKPGRPAVTRLSLAVDEEHIPLVDIETIYPAPLEDVEFAE
jgi:hypothetical protein